MKKSNITRMWLVLTGVMCLAAELRADTITYTFTGMGSGQLGLSTFSDVLFTITATADTSQITEQFGFEYDVINQTANVFVTGIGTATITDETNTHERQQSYPLILIGDVSKNRAILQLQQSPPNPALATYDMASPLAPVSGTPNFNTPQAGGIYPTTLGNFSLTAVSTISFQADVPEPSTFALIIIGAVAASGLYICKFHGRPNTSLEPTPTGS